MADWKTYAKAARNTARKHGPGMADQARDSARRGSARAGSYARAAGRAFDESTRDSRDRARKDATAYATVTQRRMREANLGRRILAVVRDAVLMGLSILVIWMVLAAAGIQIPITAVLAVVLAIIVLRVGWGLVAAFTSDQPEDIPDDPAQDPDTPS